MRGIPTALLSATLLLAYASPLFAQANDLLSLDSKESTVSYHLVHKMHRVDGVSHQVEGKARLLPTGQSQIMIRVPVESFDSGNVNRDSHMKEAVEAARFPMVEIKATGDDIVLPTAFPNTVKKSAKAQLTFHGVTQLIDVPVEITFLSPQVVQAHAQFAISLDRYQVARPSLMFIKVDDALQIDAKLTFKR